MPTIGVVLSGCGYLDGTEIYEATLTLLSLDKRGISYQCLAPDLPQMHVVNHRTGDPTGESRNVLVEAARIARGKVDLLSDVWIEKLDAVIFPGGFGAAKNFCDYAIKGEDCTIHPQIESFMRKAISLRKPLGVICISPVVLARALKGTELHPKMTVGADSGASHAVDNFGSIHVTCDVTDCVVDHDHRIVSTPAFMYPARISEVAQGIDKLVEKIAALINAEHAITIS